MHAHAAARNSPPAPRFPYQSPAFMAPTQRSAISVSHFRKDVPECGLLEPSMPGEQAFVAMLQLRDQPAHQFRANGKMVPHPLSPRGGLNLIDMRVEPMCQLRHPADTLLIHMPRAVLDELADDAGAPRIGHMAVPKPCVTRDPVLDQLQGLLTEAVRVGGGSNTLLYEHVLIGLTGHFAATYGGLQPRSTLRRGGLAPWQERRARELLSSNLAKEMSLLEIARQCDLSLAYFGRAFKVAVGMSPHSWRQARRVERAKDLLRSSSMALAEIATVCGFADQSHFSRVFAQHAAVTPGVWRRTHGGAPTY